MKRGAIKAFRTYLNETSKELHRERRYQQRKRGYGDYLYAQDREKFDVYLAEAMEGKMEGFDPSPFR